MPKQSGREEQERRPSTKIIERGDGSFNFKVAEEETSHLFTKDKKITNVINEDIMKSRGARSLVDRHTEM